jgi:uncharacterized membrane protein YgdD (TMEM256/DUF423 family)
MNHEKRMPPMTRMHTIADLPIDRALFSAATALGFVGVALGAFGAHGLEERLSAGDGEAGKWFELAVRYQFFHLPAIVIAALLAPGSQTGRVARAAGFAFALGVVTFSGTLYAMALGAPRWFGAITPFGGTLLLAGWILLLIAGLRARR